MTSTLLSPRRFDELWCALGAHGGSGPTFERLEAAYAEAHRAYHDARHIAACLSLLDEPPVRALATHPLEVEAALWFHDAIYDTHAADNEEQSAVLAEDALGAAGVAAAVRERIGAHVRATKHHVATSPDGQLVIDIDLSILGQPPEVYARFEDEIRREYAWVPPELYVTGRIEVLRRLSEPAFIYGTDLFRARLEAQARANIGFAIERLAATR